MKLLLSIFIISLFYGSLFAQRIIITKTAYARNLVAFNAKLHSINVQMYIKKTDGFYFIYTKEYATQKMAEYQLQKIHRFFPAARIVNEEERGVTSRRHEERKWIVGVGVGINSISSSANSGTSVHSNGDMSYSLKAGYFITNYLLTTLSFSSVTADNTTIVNSYFATNYYYNMTQRAHLYIGALLGYSQLSMDLPHATPSQSILYGLQAGISYDMFGYIPLSLTWQSIFLDHTMALRSGTKTVDMKTNSQNIIELGIAYKF